VKSLEKEKDHYQRKWKDTEKSLKTMSDEKGSLGKTLKDIRDDAERIVRSVDKAVPTLKSEKDKKKDDKKEGLPQKGTEAKPAEEQNHKQDEDLAVQDEVVDEKMEMEQESPAVTGSE